MWGGLRKNKQQAGQARCRITLRGGAAAYLYRSPKAEGHLGQTQVLAEKEVTPLETPGDSHPSAHGVLPTGVLPTGVLPPGSAPPLGCSPTGVLPGLPYKLLISE